MPKKISNLSNVIQLATGSAFSLALKEDGTVWWWGGLGSENELTPVENTNIDEVISLGAGRYHAMAIRSDGTLWTWGYNGYGALGDGTTIDRSSPVQVVNLDKRGYGRWSLSA